MNRICSLLDSVNDCDLHGPCFVVRADPSRTQARRVRSRPRCGCAPVGATRRRADGRAVLAWGLPHIDSTILDSCRYVYCITIDRHRYYLSITLDVCLATGR